jgi:hypothetical protein
MRCRRCARGRDRRTVAYEIGKVACRTAVSASCVAAHSVGAVAGRAVVLAGAGLADPPHREWTVYARIGAGLASARRGSASSGAGGNHTARSCLGTAGCTRRSTRSAISAGSRIATETLSRACIAPRPSDVRTARVGEIDNASVTAAGQLLAQAAPGYGRNQPTHRDEHPKVHVVASVSNGVCARCRCSARPLLEDGLHGSPRLPAPASWPRDRREPARERPSRSTRLGGRHRLTL